MSARPRALFQAQANRCQLQAFGCAGFSEPVVGTIYPRASVGWYGVPLGGLGTGYVCWDSDGRFSQTTMYNQVPTALSGNPEVPVANTIPFQIRVGGRSFGLAMRDEQGRGDLRDLRYFGHFPIVDAQFDLDLPLAVEIRAFAPFILGDAAASNTPAVVFEVHLHNQGTQTLEVEVSFAPPPTPTPIMAHEAFAEPGWAGLLVSHPWRDASPQLGGLPVLHQVAVAVEDGTVEAGSGGLIARATVSLAPDQRATRRFILAWYQPYLRDSKRRAERLRYADRFADASAVARHAIAQQAGWLRRIIAGQQAIYQRAALSDTLKEGLVNAPYAMCKNGHWIASWRPDDWFPPDGLFLMNESYTTCSISETLPCHWLGNFPMLFFFPDLELATLGAYRHYQLSSGEVPFAFDLGFGARSPYYQVQHSNGIGEYILLIHRYWYCRGDHAFLADFYASARSAFSYLMALDYDDDGLVNEHPHALPGEWWPANVPWDTWCQYGTGSYTAIKGIAATLSLARMAEAMGDDETVRLCRERVERGQERLEGLLWNGEYYRLWSDPARGTADESCLLAQVTGAWDTHLLGLPAPLPGGRLQSALQAVLRLTSGHSNYGLVLGIAPDGSPVYANHSLRVDFPRDVWPSLNFIVAALCCQYGASATTGLAAADRVLETLFRGANNMPWGWPCNLHGFTGWIGHGHDYNDPQALWTLPLAIEGQDLAAGVGPGSLVEEILTATAAGRAGRALADG